jgi:hypothetical protein
MANLIPAHLPLGPDSAVSRSICEAGLSGRFHAATSKRMLPKTRSKQAALRLPLIYLSLMPRRAQRWEWRESSVKKSF